MLCANKTKRQLTASMKELMAQAPLERISVSDIVEHTGIGRNTFYYHFQDKYDLVNWIFDDEAVELLTVRPDALEESLKRIENYFRENKEFYCNALAYTGQNCLQDHIYNTVCRMVIAHAAQMPKNREPSEEELHVEAELVSCAVIGMLVRWAQDGMRRDTHGIYMCVKRIAASRLLLAFSSAESAGIDPAPVPAKE